MSESDQAAPGSFPDVNDPQYKAAAAAAAEAVQASDQGTDAGPTVEQMADQLAAQKVRAAMSDFEQQLNDVMGKSQAAFESQQQQIALLTRQLQTVRAQAGPPTAVLLAKSLATRVQSIATAHPDLGAMHFAGVISQAGQLADEVQAVADGKASGPAEAERIAANVARWFTRSHPRLSAKVLEGWHAAVDEAERIVEELPNILPAAAAVASVL